MKESGKDAEEESTEADKPDEIVFDQKDGNRQSKPVELSEEKFSNEELRATWLRRVQTTPGDFLRAKFAYQAAQAEQQPAKKGK